MDEFTVERTEGFRRSDFPHAITERDQRRRKACGGWRLVGRRAFKTGI